MGVKGLIALRYDDSLYLAHNNACMNFLALSGVQLQSDLNSLSYEIEVQNINMIIYFVKEVHSLESYISLSYVLSQ